MTCVHRANLDQKWLKPRKGRGTIACPEKAQIVEAIYGEAGQSKTCMVKAILPEPQFAATYTESDTAEWLTRYIGQSDRIAFSLSADQRHRVEVFGEPVCPTHPLYGGVSERTGHLTTSYPPARVITGYPIAGVGFCQRPVWVQSRHSTQMPGVMAGTATGQPVDDRRYKQGATRAKSAPVGGRAAASTIRTSITEVC